MEAKLYSDGAGGVSDPSLNALDLMATLNSEAMVTSLAGGTAGQSQFINQNGATIGI